MKTLVGGGLAGVVALFLVLGAGSSDAPSPQAAPTPPGAACVNSTGVTLALTAEQRGIANRIVALGRARGIEPRGWAVAIATAMQESKLRNLTYGADDSVGVFQQRPVSGWGSMAQIRDVDYAISAFYGGDQPPSPPGLVEIPGWNRMSLTEAAQAVQRSAYPDAYAQWTALAVEQVRTLSGIELDCSKLATTTIAGQ